MPLSDLLKKLPKHRVIMNNKDHRMPHMSYNPEEITNVETTNRAPENFRDRLARFTVKGTRSTFDFISRYNENKMTKEKWMNRAIFLETVAGVPGMVGGMIRHMKSLRSLERDHGWIHHLLEEAENERMHLFFFLKEKKPGYLFRLFIWLTQLFFFNLHFFTYMLSPKFMHRFVGYLEEEAVHTYDFMLKDIESGCLTEWKQKPAPKEYIEYYNLPEDAVYRDVVLCIRADEACHRDYNHMFADLGENDEVEHENVEIINRAEGKGEDPETPSK